MDLPDELSEKQRKEIETVMDNGVLSLNEKFAILKDGIEDPLLLVKILNNLKLTQKEEENQQRSKAPSVDDFLQLVDAPTKVLIELLLKPEHEEKLEKVIYRQNEKVQLAYKNWKFARNKATESADKASAESKTETGKKLVPRRREESLEEVYKAQENVSGAEYLPSLENDFSNCFLNSVVWCVLNTVMSAIIASDDSSNGICGFFKTLFRNNKPEIKMNTADLRALFPTFASGQHDAAEFYRALVAKLPDPLMEQMTVKKTLVTTCNTCKKKERQEITNVAAETICLHDFDFYRIVGQLTNSLTVRENCDICGVHTNHRQIASYDASSTKVVALDFGWANKEQGVYDRPEVVDMFGFQWKPVSAVEYSQAAENGKLGHYWAWTKTDERWYTLNDLREVQTQLEESFKDGHLGIKMLFFEKIE